MEQRTRRVDRIVWDDRDRETEAYGTVFVQESRLLSPEDRRFVGEDGIRRQPFALYLRSAGLSGWPVLHCVSPVGDVRDVDPESVGLSKGRTRRSRFFVMTSMRRGIMREIKAPGSACDLGRWLRAEWEPGAIQVRFPNGRARKSATSVGVSITFSRPVS